MSRATRRMSAVVRVSDGPLGPECRFASHPARRCPKVKHGQASVHEAARPGPHASGEPARYVGMDPVTVLHALHGAARRERLLAAGVRRRALERAVRGGEVQAVMRGVYALPAASKARVMAAAMRGSVTCVSALREWGAPVLRGNGAHVAVPRDRGITTADPRLRAGTVVHRVASLTGIPEVDATQVLHDASRCLARDALLVAADWVLAKGWAAPNDLKAVDAATQTWLASTASALSGSPPESLARMALCGAGLRVRCQEYFSGVGRVDMVVEDAVAVEVDGRAYHSDPAQFMRDRQRDRVLQGLGYRVLRFAAAEVLADPGLVVRDVQRMLRPGVF